MHRWPRVATFLLRSSWASLNWSCWRDGLSFFPHWGTFQVILPNQPSSQAPQRRSPHTDNYLSFYLCQNLAVIASQIAFVRPGKASARSSCSLDLSFGASSSPGIGNRSRNRNGWREDASTPGSCSFASGSSRKNGSSAGRQVSGLWSLSCMWFWVFWRLTTWFGEIGHEYPRSLECAP